MIEFTVNPRDGYSQSAGSCSTGCCCANANGVPGEINKWRINYSPWTFGIGGRGLVRPTSFDIRRLTVDPALTGNLPPIVTDKFFNAIFNTPLVGVLTAGVSDPEALPLTYSSVPGQGPRYGHVAITPVGGFTYTPLTNYTGYDQFAYEVSDGVNKVRAIVRIGTNPAIGPALPANPATPYPVVSVNSDRLKVWPNMIEFPLEISGDAIVGDIYRLTITQDAMDCEGENYRHTSCYDIVIVKC